MTNEERIKADAETYANGVGDVYRKYASLYGYIAGATAEHEKAELTIDTLGKTIQDAIEELKSGDGITGGLINALEMAQAVYEQWKGGKPDRPCPHCGKELSRDRNLCCRECGKEVEDENP